MNKKTIRKGILIMNNKKEREFDSNSQEIFETVIKEVVKEVSSNVQKRYKIIDLKKVPDHANYAKVAKYIRSINIEITRKMFLSYIKDGFLPGGHEVKNANYSLYTKEQIMYYILIDMFKPILPLNKIKILFKDILTPMINETGVESTYKALYAIIYYMTQKFEESVTMVMNENISTMEEIGFKKPEEINDEMEVVRHNIGQYTNLVTLCMARGAFDFYKYSPNTLSD